jgi:O-antigen/teichoic acid export membrane protein
MNNIASKIVFGTDVLIIGIFLPISAITFYSIPSLLVNYMRNLVQTATWVLNPLVSELESIGEVTKIKNTLVRGTKYSLLVGLPIGTVFLIMGNNFISLWMGREYGEATALVLTILTVGTIAALGHNVINSVLYGLSRHNIIAYVRIAEATVNIVLTVIFVQIWGLVGVALGMAVAHVIFMGVVLPILVCRYFAFPIGQYVNECLILPILSSIPFAVCCYFINTFFPATNLVIFFLLVTSILPVFIISAWFISFSRDERAQYTKMIYGYAPFLRVFSRPKIL